MGIFDPITLKLKGREYVIPAHKVMGAICCIEDVVTLEEMRRYGLKETAPLGKLAAAYSAVLRYAGAKPEDCEPDAIYAAMIRGGEADAVTAAVLALLGMMIPPDRIAESNGKEAPRGNASTTAPPSSKKHTGPRSGANG